MFTRIKLTPHLLRRSLLMILIAASAGATDDPGIAVQQAKTLGLRGDWRAAEARLKSSIAVLSDPTGLDAIHLWNELGHVHESQSYLDAAQADYSRAVQLNEALGKRSLPDLAISFNNMGTVAELRRDFRSAEAYFRRALKTYEESGLADSAIAGAVYANLAMSIQKQGRLEEPRGLYEYGLKLLEKAYGENSPEYAKALIDFGLFEYETGNYVQALPLQRRAYEIVAALPFAPAPEKAHAMNNLGMTLLDLGSLPEAESILRQCLNIQKTAGAENLDTVLTLNNIATLEERTGRLSEARRDQTQGWRLAVRLLPSNDPILARLSSNLGKIAMDEGKTAEAKQLYMKALALWLTTDGKSSNYAATLTNVASLEAKKRHHRLAQSMYAEALRIDEQSLGQNHPRVANDVANVGIQLCFEHNFAGAIAMFRSAERIEERTFGPRDIKVARTLRMLGFAYARSKELQEAEDAYRKAIEISNSTPSDASELMGWLSEYAAILWREQKFGEAEQTYVQVNGLRVRNAITANKSQASVYP